MKDEICMVTGATSGIGAVTARALAEKGATLVVVGRNAEKSEATVNHIRQQTGNPQVEYLVADLSVQTEVRQLAEQFKSRYRHLHVLVNNAGAFFLSRQLSADGLEMTFALNHLGYFLLTYLLLDVLKASAPARIVNVSSNGHRGMKINFEDLQSQGRYAAMGAYGQSKLANLLFTYELARRLEGSGVTANALHPGFVATNLAANNGWLARLFLPLVHLFAISPEEGAQTVIYLATSREVEGVTGKYFVDKKPVESSPESYDREAAMRLWQVSAELTGLPLFSGQ
jgi:NAD(P)-dependent dehydrogenase (short-subunit alcohol dehydrogenase family)